MKFDVIYRSRFVPFHRIVIAARAVHSDVSLPYRMGLFSIMYLVCIRLKHVKDLEENCSHNTKNISIQMIYRSDRWHLYLFISNGYNNNRHGNMRTYSIILLRLMVFKLEP